MFDLAVCLTLSSPVLFAVETEMWLVRRGLIYKKGQGFIYNPEK